MRLPCSRSLGRRFSLSRRNLWKSIFPERSAGRLSILPLKTAHQSLLRSIHVAISSSLTRMLSLNTRLTTSLLWVLSSIRFSAALSASNAAKGSSRRTSTLMLANIIRTIPLQRPSGTTSRRNLALSRWSVCRIPFTLFPLSLGFRLTPICFTFARLAIVAFMVSLVLGLINPVLGVAMRGVGASTLGMARCLRMGSTGAIFLLMFPD